MSVERLKNRIVQLERKKRKWLLAAKKLQDEHDQLLLHSRAVDLLVQHQDTVSRMLHSYFQPDADSPPSIADDTGLIQPVLYDWPLMAEFQAMQLADYNWLLGATVWQVRFKVIDHLQDIARLTPNWRAKNCSTPNSSCAISTATAGSSMEQQQQQQQQQQAGLDRAVSDLLHLTKALCIITPHIVYALKDVNLLTGQLSPPPDIHWERAFCATEASLDQLAVMQQILQHIMPTMEQLEQERQELAACINSAKALNIHEQSAQAKAAAQLLLQQQQVKQAEHRDQQQQRDEEQQPQGRVGASRAAGRRAAAIRQVSAAAAATRRRSVRPRIGTAAAAAGTNSRLRRAAAAVAEAADPEPSPAGYYVTLLQQAMAAEPAPAPRAEAAPAAVADAGPSPGSAVPSSSSTSHHMQGMCEDLVADMDARLLRWRTLSGARSAVSFVFRSEQLASLLLASFPYLPMTACMCDYVPAARAAAMQREQRQQQQLRELQVPAAAAAAAAEQVMS